MQILTLITALPGAVAQGLIWGIMAIGVYITFRILDIADLTVDGTMWNFPHLYGNSRNPCRNPDTVISVFRKPEDHGKSKSGNQR